MIVLDTSVLYEIARRSDNGLAMKSLILDGERIISCELIRAEAASVFRKLVRTEGISAQDAEQYMIKGLSLIDEFYPLEPLQSEALRESIRYCHSVYDMFYFVLARRTGSTLFTIDNKFAELCHKHGVNCACNIELPD